MRVSTIAASQNKYLGRASLATVTTVGHSLTGLSIAVLTLPKGRSLMWYLLVGHFFIFFANVPDFPLPGWGHASYEVSHSIFLTGLLASIMALLLLHPRFNEQVGAKVIFFWSLTWLGHMVLDALYNHGQGIGIFWPLSDAHLVLPVPWFETLTWPPFTEHNRKVFLIELGFYGALLLTCIGIRSRSKSRNATVSS